MSELYPDEEMCQIFEANFYKEGLAFTKAKAQDERAAGNDAALKARRDIAASRVNALLDAYLDIKGSTEQVLL